VNRADAKETDVSNPVRGGRLVLLLSIGAGSIQPVLAMGGGGPPDWTKTQNDCTEGVANKGVTDATRFQREVRKCMDNPETDPAAIDNPAASSR
jgi:hypothetical protein